MFLPLAAELESQFFEQLEPATDNGQEGVEAVEYGKQADDVAPNLTSPTTLVRRREGGRLSLTGVTQTTQHIHGRECRNALRCHGRLDRKVHQQH